MHKINGTTTPLNSAILNFNFNFLPQNFFPRFLNRTLYRVSILTKRLVFVGQNWCFEMHNWRRRDSEKTKKNIRASWCKIYPWGFFVVIINVYVVKALLLHLMCVVVIVVNPIQALGACFFVNSSAVFINFLLSFKNSWATSLRSGWSGSGTSINAEFNKG